MKIIISQQDKKISADFIHEDIVDKFAIDKADEFLTCIDKLIKKHHTIEISDFKNAEVEFRGAGLLTERIIGAIMSGLYFNF